MTEPVKFPAGEWYSCTDPETLTCTTPEDAIEQCLDDCLTPKMTAAEVVAEIRARPITVTAYKPTEIGKMEIDRWADRLLDSLGEEFSDEHGNPDDGPCDAFPAHAEATMRVAVREIVRGARVWGCEEVGKVTLTPDQIEALMREWRPDWFTPEPAKERAP